MTCQEIVRNIKTIFQREMAIHEEYSTCFDDILVGYQDAHHDIYSRLQHAYPFHLLPTDFESEAVRIASVISYAIVFTPHTTRVTDSFSPQTWVEATFVFRTLSNTINSYICTASEGETVIVPRDSSRYARMNTEEAFLSSWSERHVAYTCGLGTFGLHHALITEKGCQVRLSSLVTSATYDGIAPLPLKGLYDYCLYYTSGTCRKCVAACPVTAITTEKKDMVQCYEKEDTINTVYNAEQYGRSIPTCGLCMIGVPCSTGIPVMQSVSGQS